MNATLFKSVGFINLLGNAMNATLFKSVGFINLLGNAMNAILFRNSREKSIKNVC